VIVNAAFDIVLAVGVVKYWPPFTTVTDVIYPAAFTATRAEAGVFGVLPSIKVIVEFEPTAPVLAVMDTIGPIPALRIFQPACCVFPVAAVTLACSAVSTPKTPIALFDINAKAFVFA
jgi:hypothetical protein